ncbi:hypothetical protein LRM48_001910 [Candidatus Nanosynbacter sp. TM7-008]|uniref:hypothetical protein n=1 Tax=Candidatus Nanosynbacter sp. TM7-008 TaxID=2902632 RepID=UPI001FB7FDB2|nr:hypothetical protein [Candidatus Nanosynbacter sp. TM7-008]MCJ1964239.1 hypothetical protein [Candidatus Nanosynbacter sp. TM7-008]
MDEFGFKNWLKRSGIKDKVAGDYISRLRRMARELHVDLDREYKCGGLLPLLSIFENTGNNERMKKYPNANFPIGKYYINTYKLALKKYINFKDETK